MEQELDSADTVGLVFVPGFGGHAAEYAAQVTHFAARRRAASVDPPTTGDLSIAGQADAVRAAATAAGLDRYVVVGHSLGGLTALALAKRRPPRHRPACARWE